MRVRVRARVVRGEDLGGLCEVVDERGPDLPPEVLPASAGVHHSAAPAYTTHTAHNPATTRICKA